MTGHQGVWCSNCGYEFTSEPQGEPCPRCGNTSRTYGVVQSTIATGTASKALCKRIDPFAKRAFQHAAAYGLRFSARRLGLRRATSQHFSCLSACCGINHFEKRCNSRTVGKKRTATAKGYPDWEGRAIPPGRGRSAYFQRNELGYEFFRKTRRWHLRERLIDRREKRYREYIEDAETGEVIRHKDERLSEHLAERDHRRKERSAED
jgi:hypothetical protein